MPGVLPMKVIKVGNNAQSRIAQACDRCRSKKIKCDGVRPYCSQCTAVGFECRTSDKLSRRAFPRGYTESLEERVRLLEAETRDLRGLLDDKDHTIAALTGGNARPPMTPQKESESRKRSHAMMATTAVDEQAKTAPTKAKMTGQQRSPVPRKPKSPHAGVGTSGHAQPLSGPTKSFEACRNQRKAAPAPLVTTFNNHIPLCNDPRTPSVRGIDQQAQGSLLRSHAIQQPQTYPTPQSEPARSPINMISLPTPLDPSMTGLPSSQQHHPERMMFANPHCVPYGNEANVPPVYTSLKFEPRVQHWNNNLTGESEGGQMNVYDAVYGEPRMDIHLDATEMKPTHASMMSGSTTAIHNAAWAYHHFDSDADHSDSVISFSPDDCLSNGEDVAAEWASAGSCHEDDAYAAMLLSEFAHPDNTALESVLAL